MKDKGGSRSALPPFSSRKEPESSLFVAVVYGFSEIFRLSGRMASKPAKLENPVHAAKHCLGDLPYRMVVFKEFSQHKVPLYVVAGSIARPAGADKALREAHRVHGGACFYCKKAVAEEELTIDHAEPVKLGGKADLQNLLIACKPCNAGKNHKVIEAFKPDAGREWLSALLKQVEDRLKRL